MFFCLLFLSNDAGSNCSSLKTEVGFYCWKTSKKITAHENSLRQLDSFTTWKEIEKKSRKECLIDAELQKQIAEGKRKRPQVLKKMLCCIKYLAKQNLS